jgi:hypothetical protein
MLAGVVVLGGLSVLIFYALLTAEDGPSGLRAFVWPTGLLLAAGACGAGIFMKPVEFKEAMRPIDPEPEAKPAAWIEEIRKTSEDKQP